MLPLSISIPPTREEQLGIVALPTAIERKIDLDWRRSAVLEELLRTLLRELITGETLVGDLHCLSHEGGTVA